MAPQPPSFLPLLRGLPELLVFTVPVGICRASDDNSVKSCNKLGTTTSSEWMTAESNLAQLEVLCRSAICVSAHICLRLLLRVVVVASASEKRETR